MSNRWHHAHPKPTPEAFGNLPFMSKSGELIALDDSTPIYAVETPVKEGVSVSIAERARLFDKIFEEVNGVRRSQGLQQHAESMTGRTELQVHYGVQTDNVVSGSVARAAESQQRIKDLFARASGLSTLLAAGYDPDKAKAITRQEYADFTLNYGAGQSDKKARDAKQRQIVVSAGIIDGSRYPKSGRLKRSHKPAA